MGNTWPEKSRWPERLRDLACGLRSPVTERRDREQVRAELWLLLRTSLAAAIRKQARQVGAISGADIEDLVAEKSLELFRSLECGRWEVSGRSTGEISNYISAAARNGVVDWLRRSVRDHPRPSGADRREEYGQPAMKARAAVTGEEPATADAGLEGHEFALAVGGCFGELDARSRLIWFFRVFYQMASKEIAAHPDVGLRPSHVDVLVQRARDAIRDCMEAKGYQSRQLHRGSFFELWVTLEAERSKLSRISDGSSKPT